ncbi:hybrid sensor histidine kinase/response regulator [Leptospira meyeri]|uniref:response regulator n=1 Tax=Leptospira meyeri TaxID=29508 RepID=UPI001082A238|nr:response regulator [Leptospira meyeri]TGL48027.1 hybrid sensor histidine kinase/response regulator [Leptospira meyeri]
MVESNVNQSQSSQVRTKEHLRRPKEPVLIIEDKKENQVLLEAICKRIGMDADVAEDGKVALEMAAKRPYSLYLVDLMMPVLDGKSFIREQKKIEPNAVFIIQTAIDQIDEIIEIMKMGVYDYLLKPLHVEIVADRIEKALEYVYLKRMESLLVDEESKELKSQLEWLNYKESHRKTNEINSELHSILNLKTTLMQGSGLGAMSTIIDSIQQMKVDLGKEYSINKEFWDLLYENHEHNIAMMSGLDLAVDLIQNNTNLVRTKSGDLLGLLPSLVESFRDEITERELKVNLPVVKQSVFLDLDIESMKVAIHEIFTNGLKYSKRKSHFDVFVTFVDGYFCLSAKNNIIDDEYAKQLAQSEKKLIEPFYRIHPPVESFYSKEKFSLGLGLTMVDFILHRHNGMFFIRNAIDHTTEVKADCIIAEVFLPIQNEK